MQFKQLEIYPKLNIGTSTGFEPMASALALQSSTIWAIKTHTLGAGQVVDLILTCARNDMKMMWTGEIQILTSEDMIIAVVNAI